MSGALAKIRARGGGGIMPSLAARIGLDSGVHRLLELPPAPNGVAPTTLREFLGSQAAAGGWPEAAVRMAALAKQAGTPTYGASAPWLGGRDGLVLGDGTAWFADGSGTTEGNVGTSDLWLRFVGHVVASKNIAAKRNAGVGWQLAFNATPALVLTIQDASGSVAVTSGTLVAGSIIRASAVINRNEASTNGGQIYVDGAASGSGVDCSTRALTINAAVALALLADSAGASPLTTWMAFFGLYSGADWIRAGATGQADVLEQHKRMCAALAASRPAFSVVPSTYPSSAGSTSPVYQQRRLADGTDRLFYMGPGSPTFDRIVDSAGRAVVGHLVELGATNLTPNNWTIGSWSQAGLVASVTAITPPNGVSSTAHVQREFASLGGHYRGPNACGNEAAASTYTAWVIVKAVNRTWCFMEVTQAKGNATGALCYFDLVNLVFGATVGVQDSQGYVALGGGWYLIWMKWLSVAGGGAMNQYVGASNGDNGVTYLGIADNDPVATCGAQVEVGDWPSSSIITAAAAVTRAASVCQYSLTNCFPRAEGTLLFALLARSFTPTRNRVAFSLSDGSTANELQVYTDTSGRVNASSRKAAGVSGDCQIAGSIFDNAIRRGMLSWRQNDLRLWLRSAAGVWTLAQDTTCDAIAGATLTTLSIGSDGASANQAGPGLYSLAGWQILPEFVSDPSAARSGFDTLWAGY